MAKNLQKAIDSLDLNLEFNITEDEAVANLKNSNEFASVCVAINKLPNIEDEEGNDVSLKGSSFNWKLYDDEDNEYDLKVLGDFDLDEYKVTIC